ncbi:unnamed protein product, partial [Amoebophrya sp. A25]|eukprot:GSA25T00009792001.1
MWRQLHLPLSVRGVLLVLLFSRRTCRANEDDLEGGHEKRSSTQEGSSRSGDEVTPQSSKDGADWNERNGLTSEEWPDPYKSLDDFPRFSRLATIAEYLFYTHLVEHTEQRRQTKSVLRSVESSVAAKVADEAQAEGTHADEECGHLDDDLLSDEKEDPARALAGAVDGRRRDCSIDVASFVHLSTPGDGREQPPPRVPDSIVRRGKEGHDEQARNQEIIEQPLTLGGALPSSANQNDAVVSVNNHTTGPDYFAAPTTGDKNKKKNEDEITIQEILQFPEILQGRLNLLDTNFSAWTIWTAVLRDELKNRLIGQSRSILKTGSVITVDRNVTRKWLQGSGLGYPQNVDKRNYPGGWQLDVDHCGKYETVSNRLELERGHAETLVVETRCSKVETRRTKTKAVDGSDGSTIFLRWNSRATTKVLQSFLQHASRPAAHFIYTNGEVERISLTGEFSLFHWLRDNFEASYHRPTIDAWADRHVSLLQYSAYSFRYFGYASRW